MHQLARLVNNLLQNSLCIDLLSIKWGKTAKDTIFVTLTPFMNLTQAKLCVTSLASLTLGQHGLRIFWNADDTFQIALLAVSFPILGALHWLMAITLLLAWALRDFLRWVFFQDKRREQLPNIYTNVFCCEFFLCCFPSRVRSLDSSSHSLFPFLGLFVLSDLSKEIFRSVESFTCWISVIFWLFAVIARQETSG